MKSILALVAALALPIAYAADAPAAAPAAAPAVDQPTVKPSCEKPEYPGKFADQPKFDRFNKKYKAYADCMKKFIDEQTTLVKTATTNGNAAINEFNAFVKSINEQAGNQ